MAKDNTARKLALGALIAGTAGYLAGILTAPKSGKETRADVARKAGELQSEAVSKLQELNEELTDLIKSAKSKTLNLTGRALAEFNEALEQAKEAKDKSAQVLRAVKAGEADDPELNKAVKQAKLAQKNLAKFLKS